ncbi:MAG: DUF4405 domain-containing protein [Eubacteriales bacterium]|nr:DUF4405 domain-containing protein [Eubacteriales bacterium]
MRTKPMIRMAVNLGMVVLLMLLMAFELVGREAHEWIGMAMFVLFVIHHILNRKWLKNTYKGKYTLYRVVQTALVFLIFLTMAGSMISGIWISREVFDFLPHRSGYRFAQNLHMLSAYWGFILMALHLGFHWAGILGMVKKAFGELSDVQVWIMRIVGLGIAGYGIYAFYNREIGSYMFLQIEFVFYNLEEPIFFFFLDYLAVMCLFIWIGYYLSKAVRRSNRRLVKKN